MAWAGTGDALRAAGRRAEVLCLERRHRHQSGPLSGDFSFVQISDSHIGFNKAANPDVTATLQQAIAKINALARAPDFMLHTGDLTHSRSRRSSTPWTRSLKRLKDRTDLLRSRRARRAQRQRQAVPRTLRQRNSKGDGWYSFDQNGVHFIGLVNVMNLKAGGLGTLGAEQLEWLEDDVASSQAARRSWSSRTFRCGRSIRNGAGAPKTARRRLSYLKRFGSVTVLNGHIHQTMQKVEGNVTFHTAMSTAFPQPEPGKAQSPGPMKVPAEKLRRSAGNHGRELHSRQTFAGDRTNDAK